MKLRHILVAASAAALLAGSSYGALAGSWSSSKSGTVQISHADPHTGATTVLLSGGQAKAGGSQASATYKSWGGGAAVQKTTYYDNTSISKYGYSDTSYSSKTSVAISAGGSSGCASVGPGSAC